MTTQLENGDEEKIYGHTSTLQLETKEEDTELWKKKQTKHPLGFTGALLHMIKSSLGSGILTMPVSFKNGGLWVSLGGAIFVGVLYAHCVHLLVFSSRVLCLRVKRPTLEFAEMAEAAFKTGPARLRPYTNIARDVVDVGLSVTYYMCCVVYVVFTASSIKQVVELNFDVVWDIRLYILMVTMLVLPIGLIRDLKYLVPFSLVAIVALVFGCGFVLWDVFRDLPSPSTRPAFTSFHRLPVFLATMIYAMDGIGTVLPIENAMKNPERFLGLAGVLNISIAFLMILYCTVGFFGYLRYGEATEGTITLNISSSYMGQAVKIMVSLNVLCTYGLFFFVPIEIFWRKLKPKVKESSHNVYYYTMRSILVISTVLIAVAVPDLEPFVGLVGAVCSSSLVLFFPPVLELVTFWQDREHMGHFHWRLYKNVIILLFWAITMFTGAYQSILDIVKLYREQ